jgi:hypothetical protein
MLIELWARKEIYGNEKANVNRKIISDCGKPVSDAANLKSNHVYRVTGRLRAGREVCA